MTFTPQSTRSVVDRLEISIAPDTTLEAGEPLSLENTDVDLVRLHVGGGGHSVTIWIDRSETTRLIGAIVAAAAAPVPPAQTEPALADPIPF